MHQRTGSPNKGWRKAVAEHRNATTAYSAVHRTFEADPGFCHLTHKASGIWVTSKVYGDVLTTTDMIPSIDTSINTQLQNRSLLAFIAAVGEANKSAFQGQVFLAEFSKAVKTLASPFKSLRGLASDYLGHVAKLPRSKAYRKLTLEKKLKVVGQSYLELKFGILPFVHDMQAAAESLRKISNDEEYIRVGQYSTRKGESASISPATTEYVTGNIAVWNIFRKTRCEHSTRMSGEVRRSRTGSNFPTQVFHDFKLGIDEFIPTVWELLPYSWLVDYVTNIGDVLSAGVVDTSTLAWYYRNTRVRATKTLTGQLDVSRLKALWGANMQSATGYYGKLECKQLQLWRDVPPLIVPDVEFFIDAGPLQWLNVASLFAAHTPSLNRAFGLDARPEKVQKTSALYRNQVARFHW